MTISPMSVLDSLPVGLLIASAADGRICYANRAAGALFGQDSAALLGNPWPHARLVRRLDGTPFPQERLPLWRSLHQGERVEHVEMCLNLPSGARRETIASSAPIRDAEGRITGALVVYRDAGHLQALREALAGLSRELEAGVVRRTSQLEKRQRQLEALVVAGMALAGERSQEAVLQRLTEIARDLLQAQQTTLCFPDAAGEMNRITVAGPMGEVAAPSAHSIGTALREILGEGAAGVGAPSDTADGRPFLNVPIICRGQVFGQLQVTDKDDLAGFSDTDEILAVGLAAQAAIALENLRLFQDLEAQQERMLRAERLSSIGTLAGGIAHDLRQPLSVLKLNVQLLQRSAAPRPEAERRRLDRIEQQVDRATRIIQDLLALARDESPRASATDLGRLVEQFATAQTLPPSMTLRLELSPGLPFVPVDPGQIQQVLDNLTRNAVEAMAERPGTLTLAARRSGEWAEIGVRDEGIGIPRDQISRVFEPLFTTRRRGTGLGLTLCQQIVAAHGGEIHVESEEGKGTYVVVRLPLHE